MDFTYSGYNSLISLLKDQNYSFSSYHNWTKHKKSVILRHDVDYSIEDSLKLSELEQRLGVKSTYFILLTSDFYNVFSRNNINMLRNIMDMDHEIGLHFDEMNYPSIVGNQQEIIIKIQQEAKVLEEILGIPIKTVSMHRPSKEILKANLEIPCITNSYSDIFFRDFKYLSDSRRRWREPVEEIVSSNKYNKLHILTHAFWYNDSEVGLRETLSKFVCSANAERYGFLLENFTNLDEALGDISL